MGRSQRHKVEERGYATRGNIYEQGAINDQILGALGGTLVNAQPVLSSINPTSAVMGGADLTLHCIGSNFTSGGHTVILFNGGVENTTFVSPTELTTIVKPSLAGVPGSYPVQVEKAGILASADTKYFSFTATELAARSAPTDDREHGPFSLKRIEPDDEGGVWYVLDRCDIREGDKLRAEATGSSSTNGDFEARDISNDVEGETAIYWKSPSITVDIVGKGRITVL